MTTEKNVEIYRCISILPDDYQEMDNKPTMNGATIEGDLTAKDLKLMSSDSDDYQSISKEEAAEKFIPVIDKDGNVHKISVSDLPTGGGNGNAGEEDTENTPVKPAELLAEPVIFETAEHEGMHQGDSMIGLVAGKTYKVSALVGASATLFEYEAVAIKIDEEGGSAIQIATPDDALFNNHLAIWIMDAAGEVNGEPINTNIIMIGGRGEGSDPENGSGYSDEFFANEIYSPVIINSIKEVETVVEYASKKSVDELTERVTILEKSNDTNLLGGEPITIQGNADGDSFKVVDFSLGMKAGKQYEIKANVDGHDVVVYGKTENHIENVVMLLPVDGGDFVMLVDQSVSLMLFDNCDLSNDEPTPTYNKCLLGLQEYDEIAHNVILNSIVEVQEEYASAKIVNALSEQVNSMDARILALENGDESQNLLSEPIMMAEVWNFQTPIITSTLNLELGKTYKVSGYHGGESLDNSEGATPFEQTAVATTGEAMGLPDIVILVLPDYQTSQNPDYYFSMTFIDKVSFEITDTGGGAVLDDTKAAVAFGKRGQDEGRQSAKNIVIESIAKAQVEYATVSYVDNLIAEINDKLEALLNGTEA